MKSFDYESEFVIVFSSLYLLNSFQYPALSPTLLEIPTKDPKCWFSISQSSDAIALSFPW